MVSTVGGVIGYGANGEMKNATVASSTIIADTASRTAGGGIGFAKAITAVELTVIDTVIDVVNTSSLLESAVGGGLGLSEPGVQFSNTMIIKTNLSIKMEVVRCMLDGVGAGWEM
ncbi:MAG: hypothetical protein QS721_15550 [Candidatus Endonucleobacter sp. (ex Gigantidas childressi)]|nr:hypothetical protein [Candidatus Endonucleobacter sp. (ex Gigantidas childressi)]